SHLMIRLPTPALLPSAGLAPDVARPIDGALAAAAPTGLSARQQTLQAFATLLTQTYQLPCHLVWHPHDDHQHRLYVWTPSAGWPCQAAPEPALAHQLQVLGMAQRAAQRQRHPRQAPEDTR